MYGTNEDRSWLSNTFMPNTLGTTEREKYTTITSVKICSLVINISNLIYSRGRTKQSVTKESTDMVVVWKCILVYVVSCLKFLSCRRKLDIGFTAMKILLYNVIGELNSTTDILFNSSSLLWGPKYKPWFQHFHFIQVKLGISVWGMHDYMLNATI